MVLPFFETSTQRERSHRSHGLYSICGARIHIVNARLLQVATTAPHTLAAKLETRVGTSQKGKHNLTEEMSSPLGKSDVADNIEL